MKNINIFVDISKEKKQVGRKHCIKRELFCVNIKFSECHCKLNECLLNFVALLLRI